MERIQLLISKLKDLADQNASPAQILLTVQMLQNELYQLQVNGSYTLGTSKVAVMLPKTINISVQEKPAQKTQEIEQPAVAAPVLAEPVSAGRQKASAARRSESSPMLFDPLFETPTLSHQQGVKEINEMAAHQ